MADRSFPLISITGFMGTGKTETAKELARILGLSFVDMDALIEQGASMSVSEIFENHGEEYFRKLEEGIVAEMAGRRDFVVATGGGAILNEKNYEALSERGVLVLLDASVDSILERVGEDNSRPLLDTRPPSQSRRDRIEELLAERKPVYDRITFRIDTTNRTPFEAACAIAASLDIPFTDIFLPYPEGALRPHPADDEDGVRKVLTNIEVGRGLLSNLGTWLKECGLDSRAIVFVPEKVRELHFDQLAASLIKSSIPMEVMTIKDGDKYKNLKQTGELLEKLARSGVTRDQVAVAFGGGVTGDLVGLVASTYMRGIPLVQVPTTLLAQVDASIGGKTGVNLPVGKNLVGTFYPARLVIIDPCVLDTLPDHEIANGMAEVVKTAILGSPGLFEYLAQELLDRPAEKLREINFLERCVRECATVKAGVVLADPFERDERRMLNLGHTLGHTFEVLGGYTELSHGQAVSIGMVAALRIAVGRKMIDEKILNRTVTILEACNLPTTPPHVDKSYFNTSLHMDKKKKKGQLRFVLPAALGHCIIVDDVGEDEIFSAIGA
ncbi:MAG: 3-dehydroquinate synthase [Planctomycetota bacterium]|jgi:3-dehydroquinate synthase